MSLNKTLNSQLPPIYNRVEWVNEKHERPAEVKKCYMCTIYINSYFLGFCIVRVLLQAYSEKQTLKKLQQLKNLFYFLRCERK